MKIYFVTHSTTTDNEKGLSAGWKDSMLSKLGIRQAKELGERFENIRIDLIYCSDLSRAVETARIAFGSRIPVSTDNRLREINYGDLNGRPVDVVKPMAENRLYEPFPGGESYQQAILRIHDFCLELKENHKENVILIVGHRATQFGLDTFTGKRSIEECLSAPFIWQQYWEYNL